MERTLNRRRLVGAIVAVPAVLASSSTSAMVGPPLATSNPRIRRAIALHDRVEAECERFDVEVELPACEAWAAAIKAQPTEPPPPHEESATTFFNHAGDVVRLSTRGVGSPAIAWRVAYDPEWADMGDADWRQAHLEIAAAHDRRDAILAEQAAQRDAFERQSRQAHQIDAYQARSTALADRRYRLWWLAVTAPAGSLDDVVTKLAFIDRTREGDVDGDMMMAIATDIRRLAGEAGA